MTKILVMQLSRVGDILMTGPLLRGLRREHPSAEISLMVMDSFTAAPLPPRLYDRLIAFPLEGLALTLAKSEPTWEPALRQLRDFVRDCAPTPVDVVVNLSHTETSGLVASLVPAKKRVGFTMRANRLGAIDGPWMTYLRAAARSRELASFHLVDLFSWTANVGRDEPGLEIEITQANRDVAGRFLEERGLTGRPLIAMMLGASSEAKRWPVERFAVVADALEPALGDIVLVGGPDELVLSAAFVATARRPVFDVTGKTSLGEMAALLKRCRLLVTNDTGPMHVATAAGTRVMDISLGPVSACETGPYGSGHVVVEPELPCSPCPVGTECHHFACRFSLSAEDAAAVVRFAMDAGPAPAISGARVLQSRRSAASGRLEFVPVASTATVSDFVRVSAADVWEQTLGAPKRVGPGWREGNPELASPSAGPGSLATIHTCLTEVVREAEAAVCDIGNLTKAPPARRQAIAAAVQARYERILALGEEERAVHSLVTYLRYEIGSATAGDLASMARSQAIAYRATARRAKLLCAALNG